MFIPYRLNRIEGFFHAAEPELQLTFGMVIIHIAIWCMVITMVVESASHRKRFSLNWNPYRNG